MPNVLLSMGHCSEYFEWKLQFLLFKNPFYYLKTEIKNWVSFQPPALIFYYVNISQFTLSVCYNFGTEFWQWYITGRPSYLCEDTCVAQQYAIWSRTLPGNCNLVVYWFEWQWQWWFWSRVGKSRWLFHSLEPSVHGDFWLSSREINCTFVVPSLARGQHSKVEEIGQKSGWYQSQQPQELLALFLLFAIIFEGARSTQSQPTQNTTKS